MEGLLPSNSWAGSGGHGASVLAIVRPSSSGPLALFQICICIFFAAHCSSTDESQFVAVHPPSPPSRSPRSPPAPGWTTMPSTLENQGTSMPW